MDLQWIYPSSGVPGGGGHTLLGLVLGPACRDGCLIFVLDTIVFGFKLWFLGSSTQRWLLSGAVVPLARARIDAALVGTRIMQAPLCMTIQATFL